MDKGIIEGCEDVCNSKDLFTLCNLRTERDGVLFLGCFDFFGRLEMRSSKSQYRNPAFMIRFKRRK